jgi:hypothetical protein
MRQLFQHILDEVGEGQEVSNADQRPVDQGKVRSFRLDHPGRNRKTAISRLDQEDGGRPIKHTEASESLPREGVKPVVDRDKPGTGSVRYACTVRPRRLAGGPGAR